MKLQKAVFGAGCFWHVEEKFRTLNGVLKTIVGYMGGKTINPSYEDVCSDKTGHIEVCEVEFDPKQISYKDLLSVFWKIHNPTQINRQGLDIGTQYKSVIFYFDENQKKLAESSKEKEQKSYSTEIVTEINPVQFFFKAEDYHQNYLMKKNKNS